MKKAAHIYLLVLAGCIPSSQLPGIDECEEPYVGQSSIPQDLTVTMRRDICYGTCPIYTVALDSSGLVEFFGEQFVSSTGQHFKNVNQDVVQGVVEDFNSADFFCLDGDYDHGNPKCERLWSDSPTVTTSILYDGASKTVRHNHGCTGGSEIEILTDLENNIDTRLGTIDWIL